MKTVFEKAAGKATPTGMRFYRKNPGDFLGAVGAAATTAKKLGKRIVIVEGNSYGARVYHLATEADSLAKYTAMRVAARVLCVEADGVAFYATAED